MNRFARFLALAFLAAFASLAAPVMAQPMNQNELIILTTTTTQDTGILRILTDAFAKKSGLAVKPIVAGSGDILKQGARGEGDVLLTTDIVETGLDISNANTMVVDAEAKVPREFIPETDVRLEIYRRLARTGTLGALEELAEELTDRFGTLPKPLLGLLDMTRLRVLCEQHNIAAVHAGPNGIAITEHDGTRRVLAPASPTADRLQRVLEEVRSRCGQSSASESGPSPMRP